MKKREYVTFMRSIVDIAEGQETKLLIRDLSPGPQKYDAQYVKAKLFSSQEQSEEGDILWIRSMTGVQYPNPWVIKIVQQLPEYVPGHPYMDIFEALKRWEP